MYLGLENGNFGAALPGWKDHGSISAINASTGRRVWKFNTPEPERGGVTVTASGLGFAGGGDGVLRAFDVTNGKVLWTFQTGRQIAAGPTIFTAGGKQYIAITVGGTPTSSGGGLASQLQVFAIGGSKTQSPSPFATSSGPLASTAGAAAPAAPAAAAAPAAPAAPASPSATRSAAGATTTPRKARVVIDGGAVSLTTWTPSTSNLIDVRGRVLFGGSPVVGAQVAVDRYTLPRATDSEGRFVSPVDSTLARRHPVTVVDASRARVGGRALTDAEQRALRGATSGVSVAYRISGVTVRERNGNVVVSGRATNADGAAVPPVVLLSYRLSGRITDSAGNPIRGATVVTRSNDRDFWTFSEPSDANGRYNGFFPASDKSGSDPVEFAVQIAFGRVVHDRRTQPGLQAPLELDDGRSPAGLGHRGAATHDDGGARRDLPRPAGGRLWPKRPRQAHLRHMARRSRAVHDRASPKREGADAPVLAERVPDLHDTCRSRRARHPDVADAPFPACPARHRLRAGPR